MYELANYWILQTLAMMLTVFLLPRLYLTNILGAIFTVVALSFINTSIWSATLFFAIPIEFTTHTAVLFAANGLIFWILVKVLPGIEVEGFLAAFAAPIVFTFCSYFGYQYGREIDWIQMAKQGMGIVSEVKEELLESTSVTSSEHSVDGTAEGVNTEEGVSTENSEDRN